MKIFKSGILSLIMIANLEAMEERSESPSIYRSTDDFINALLDEGYTVESLIEYVLEAKEIGRPVYAKFLGRTVPIGMVTDISVKTVRETFLHMAARNGSASMIEKLIASGAVVNAHNDLMRSRPNDYETPVQLAARRGHPRAVQILLENKADCNQAFAEAIKEDQKEIIDMIFRLDPNLNEALKVAVRYKKIELVKKLIELGADVNYEDTILNLAVTYLSVGNTQLVDTPTLRGKAKIAEEIVEILLASGAKVNRTCLYDTVRSQSTYAEGVVLSLKIIEMLINAGGDINDIGMNPFTEKWQTPLALVNERLRECSGLSPSNGGHHSTIYRCKTLKKFLTKHGAKKNLIGEFYEICKSKMPFKIG